MKIKIDNQIIKITEEEMRALDRLAIEELTIEAFDIDIELLDLDYIDLINTGGLDHEITL
jgi:hypothetical protein